MSFDDQPNFEKINYNLRPGKNVERKMLCEAFSRLSILDNIKNYHYIGFGSVYFTDFALFHKTLGIRNLTSIEYETDYQERVEFNKPYSCVDVVYGESSEVLPRLTWGDWNKTITWLDYTGKLEEYMLGDIRTVVSMKNPGSVFLLSINIDPDKISGDPALKGKEFRLNKLESRVRKANVPSRAYNMKLDAAENKAIIREIINNTILNTLKVRNGVSEEDDKIYYKQLFNFYYKDKVGMLTVGGILYNKEQEAKIEKMSFNNLEFIKEGEECFDIIVPNLTFREIHALDKLLPCAPEAVTQLPVDVEDIKNYSNIYRYFPTFTEANL